MKKFFKVLIPILLALVVLGSIAWYLLVYDRGFTRDLLLSHARYQERKGNHSFAAWIYDKAYYQSSQDEDVAIELAEQFKSIGNYTKAEYTLSNAIADGASAKLYVALCKTYVEQDKLLDAVTMLNNVTDPEIKAQLNAMRPDAPTVSPAPGFYTQYISVSVESDSNLLFVNTDGEYPSTGDEVYSDPITLPAGETTIYALSVGDNGLVSELGIYGYTVGGVIEPVTFSDSNFEHYVRTVLNVADDKQLYTNDLWEIKTLEIPENVTSYEDLKLLSYLETLTIVNGTGDLSSIASLNSLKELNLNGCALTDDNVKAIGTLSSLTKAVLTDCKLSTISGLEGAKQLQYLDLSNNTIRNLDPISSLNQLQELNLQHNALTDLKVLSGLSTLQKLDVSYNALTSVTPLSGCNSLVWLDFSNNSVTSVEGINKLTALTYLNASSNQLTDVTPLASCVNLEKLYIASNSLTMITELSPLVKLTVFDFSNNQVTALPNWSDECSLVTIDGSNNQLETIDILSGFQNLNNVYMDYNLLTSVDALTNCPRLMIVNVYGNAISNVSKLTDMGVSVNYNPLES